MSTELNPYNELLAWSLKRPAWQRDALRRLFVNGKLSEKDLDDLIKLLELEKKLLSVEEQKALSTPLDESHLPISSEKNSSNIIIKQIKNPTNVNALNESQVLNFSEAGLTVIYGGNGTGKSGYARILKKACRARSSGGPIKPNVYQSKRTGKATAQIVYAKASNETTVNWKSDEPTDSNLSAISFFDSDCANVHVTSENDVAFTPFFLAVLNDLADICRTLGQRITLEKVAIQKLIGKKVDIPKEYTKTEPAKLVTSLNSTTKKEEIEALISDEQNWDKRITEINSLLAKEPDKEIKKQKEILINAQSLLTNLNHAKECLSEQMIKEFNALSIVQSAAQEAAKISAQQLFKDEPIKNIGSPAWKILWESARTFATNLYGDGHFPVSESHKHCVLCLQEMDANTQARLIKFNDFIINDVEKKLKEANFNRQSKLNVISNIRLKEKTRNIVGVLSTIDSQLSTDIRGYIIILRKRLRFTIKNPQIWDEEKIPKQDNEVLDRLKTTIQRLEELILKLESSKDPVVKAKMEGELNELKAKQWLKQISIDIKEKIDLHKKIEDLQGLIQDCNTTAITKFSGDLSNKYITNVLRDRFADEVNRLKINSVKAELVESTTEYARQNYRIQLIAAPNEKLGEVLSEGEFRCLSIAGFLAELATADHQSGLIFDDPVSSLDHKFRKRVAQRLVEESANRQVVVFTHDVLFLFALKEAAEESGSSPLYSHIARIPNPGTVCEDLPWFALPVKKRIGALKNKLQSATAVYNKGDETAYKPMAGILYGELRETWERMIEEVLLNHTIVRFGEEVQTQRLKKVTDFSEADYEKIERGMSKCSTYMTGHDKAAAINFDEMPTPDELAQDINLLEELRSEVEKRRSKAR